MANSVNLIPENVDSTHTPLNWIRVDWSFYFFSSNYCFNSISLRETNVCSRRISGYREFHPNISFHPDISSTSLIECQISCFSTSTTKKERKKVVSRRERKKERKRLVGVCGPPWREKRRRRRKKGKTKRWPQRWMLYPTWQAKIISHYSKFDAPLTRTCRPWGERYTFYLFVAWYRLFSPYLFSSFYLQAAKVFPVRNSNSLMHLQNLKKKRIPICLFYKNNNL